MRSARQDLSGWNTPSPNGARFDPYPEFVSWLSISNMIQIFHMPLLMIGQNLQGRHAEIRAIRARISGPDKQ